MFHADFTDKSASRERKEIKKGQCSTDVGDGNLVQRGNWKPYRLDQLGYVGRGRSRSRPRNNPALYGGAYPLFETGDIKSADLYLSNPKKTYNEKGLAQSKLWNPGTVCITIAANIAETAILKIKACFPDSVVGFVADLEKADARFIKYYIDFIKLQMQNISHGTTQDNLSVEKLLTFDFFTPPLSTQRKIAVILGNYDDLIENNTRRINILEEMAKTIYREWFIEFRFPGHENAKKVESELGMIPQGWEVKRLGEVSLNFDRLRKPLSGQVRSAIQGEYPYYGAASILDHVNDYLFDGRYLLIGEDGSVITKDGRPVLQLVAEKFWANNHTHVVQGKSPISTNFLYLLMSNVAISGYITGTAQPKINQENLNRIPLVSPPRDLLERFDQIVNPICDDIVILDRKNINLRKTRDLLLPKLISGELDVSELDINTYGTQPRKGGTHIPYPLTDRLHSDEKILNGKPVIKGTRLAVEFIIDLLGHDWGNEDILENYPNIVREDIEACRAYQKKVMNASVSG